MSVTIHPIYSQTAGAGGIGGIDFTNIPQGYTDLMIKVSVRGRVNGYDSFGLRFNDIYNDITSTQLNNDAGSFTSSRSSYRAMGAIPGTNLSSQYFAQFTVYIPEYTSGFKKAGWIESSSENNSTAAYMGIRSWSCAQTAPVRRIGIDASTSGQGWAEGTVFTLYGILNSDALPKATGGDITSDGTYFYHTFRSTGTTSFTPLQNLNADILIIGGGGSGCSGSMFQGVGGGGAGGLLYRPTESLLGATSYTVTVGAGGIAPAPGNLTSQSGGNSVFGSFTAIGGGGGGGGDGLQGGSGGGGGSQPQVTNGGAGGAGTSGQGNAGGRGFWNGSHGGGGGGAGSAGQNAPGSGVAGTGGAGLSSYSDWGRITGTGQNISGTWWFAGGGGGGASSSGNSGGNGGGGNGATSGTNHVASAGLPNTGGGGGGAYDQGATGKIGGNGGSGVVIVRYTR